MGRGPQRKATAKKPMMASSSSFSSSNSDRVRDTGTSPVVAFEKAHWGLFRSVLPLRLPTLTPIPMFLWFWLGTLALVVACRGWALVEEHIFFERHAVRRIDARLDIEYNT